MNSFVYFNGTEKTLNDPDDLGCIIRGNTYNQMKDIRSYNELSEGDNDVYQS